jgi:hypothetical protein
LIIQGCFVLVLQFCIYRAFIKLPPPSLLTCSLLPCSSNIHIQMDCFSIFHSLKISLPVLLPIVPSRQTHKYNFVPSLTVYVNVYI